VDDEDDDEAGVVSEDDAVVAFKDLRRSFSLAFDAGALLLVASLLGGGTISDDEDNAGSAVPGTFAGGIDPVSCCEEAAAFPVPELLSVAAPREWRAAVAAATAAEAAGEDAFMN
jgi:hypothetical protein